MGIYQINLYDLEWCAADVDQIAGFADTWICIERSSVLHRCIGGCTE